MVSGLFAKIADTLSGKHSPAYNSSIESVVQANPQKALDRSANGGYTGSDLETLLFLGLRHKLAGHEEDGFLYAKKAAGIPDVPAKKVLDGLNLTLDNFGYSILQEALLARADSVERAREVISWVRETDNIKNVRLKLPLAWRLASELYNHSPKNMAFAKLAGDSAFAYWQELDILRNMTDQTYAKFVQTDVIEFFNDFLKLGGAMTDVPERARELFNKGHSAAYSAPSWQTENARKDGENCWKPGMMPTEMRMGREYLKILGIETENVTIKDVRTAFRKKAFETHPDRNPGIGESAFKVVNEAWMFLDNHMKQ